MTVSPLSFGSATPGADQTQPKTPKDEFLNLLVAQLEHQDPLAPQDSAQFVAQLAQFTQVEQAAETNVRLEALEAAEAAGLRSSFANIVGREVTARGSEVVVTDGKPGAASHSYKLDTPADRVEIVVRNEAGDEVARFEENARGSGEWPIAWDGTNQHGTPVADGKYTFEVHAEDADGEKVDVTTQIKGRASAIDFTGGVIKFTVGGAEITPADILTIAE